MSQEWDKRRVATEHSIGKRMIGAFNLSFSVAKRRSQPFVPRFDCKYSELQAESGVLSQTRF